MYISLTPLQIIKFTIAHQLGERFIDKNEILISLIVAYQNDFDIRLLAFELLYRQQTELLMDVFVQEHLESDFRFKLILETFKQAIELEELVIAMDIWKDYNLVLHEFIDETISAVCRSFEISASFLELKFFFLSKVLAQMSYQKIDRILDTFEQRYSNMSDFKNNYLLANSNPILTACHILYFLDLC